MNKTFINTYLVTLMFIISSCGSQANTTEILVTPTKVKDLRFYASQTNNLPKYFHLKDESMPWRIYPNIPHTNNVYYHEIIMGDDPSNEVGHISIFIYDDTSLLEEAYEAVRSEAELYKEVEPLDIGEKGSKSGPIPSFNASDVLFQKCSTIIHISIHGDRVQLITDYAHDLLNSIEPVICSP